MADFQQLVYTGAIASHSFFEISNLYLLATKGPFYQLKSITVSFNLESQIVAWQVLLRKALLSLAILLGVVIASPVYCEEYYVDGNTGNDAGAGTYEDPWRTITHAVSQTSGTDTVYVKCATYHESVSFTGVANSSINLIGMANGSAKPIICSADPNIHTVSLTNYV